MDLAGTGTRVRIYFGELDHYQGKALWSALLEFLRHEQAAGATVVRGVAGFGAHSRLHVAHFPELSADLPLVLEWVDTVERVHRLLPRVTEMLEGTGGLITTDAIEIHRYLPHR
jgi:PII-like signaling protein